MSCQKCSQKCFVSREVLEKVAETLHDGSTELSVDLWIHGSMEATKGAGRRPPPFVGAASFVLALNTGHILLLRRKTCALLRAKASALLRRKTCAVLRARTCASFRANTKETTKGGGLRPPPLRGGGRRPPPLHRLRAKHMS